MALPGGTPLTSLSGGAGAQRTCPQCGTVNGSDFQYCKQCGRPLAGLPASPSASFLPPPPGTAPGASAPAAPSIGPVPRSADGSVVQRPLTQAESGQLLRLTKTGAPGALRFLGAFLGIVPLALIGAAFLGTPFEPENFLVIVLGAGLLGAILGGISQGQRTPLVRAAKGGTAIEVMGVPEIQSTGGNRSLVGLGGLTFRMRASQAARLLPNRVNRVTFADGGPTAGAARRLGTNLAVLLESNGHAATKAEACYLVGPASAETSATSVFGATMAQGR